MGKAPKRNRKFLSKNILPRKRKSNRHGDRKSKELGSSDRRHSLEKPTSSAPPLKEPKTLPDGLDTADFFDVPWLDCQADNRDAEHDTCADWLEPESSLHGPSGDNHDLTEQSVRAMMNRAVDDGSVDDLLRVLWALQIAYGAPSDDSQGLHLSAKKKLRDGELRALTALSSVCFKRLHLAFRFHLGPVRDPEHTTEEWEELCVSQRQLLEKSDSWGRLGRPLLNFLTIALDVVQLASRAAGRGPRSHVLESLHNMRPHISLMFPFARLARRYLVCLLAFLESSDDPAVLSLAFVRLYELSVSQPMPFLHDAFKGIYRAYRSASDRVGNISRGVGAGNVGESDFNPLPLLRECVAELFSVEKPSAYLHAYVYIHDLVREGVAAAAEVRQHRSGKSREAGPAMRRLRSWGFLQSLMLWTCVVAANPRTLGALVPALAKVLEITFELSPGLYGAPRTLALARCAQDLAAAAGVYLPTSPHLLNLLELLHARSDGHSFPPVSAPGSGAHDPEMAESAGSGSGEGDRSRKNGEKQDMEGSRIGRPQEADLSLVAGLGKEDLRLGHVLAAVTRSAVSLIAREITCCYRWSAALPEMCSGIDVRLVRLLDGGVLGVDGGAGTCRGRVRWLRGVLQKAGAQCLARRAAGNKHPGDASAIDTFRSLEEPTATERLLAFKETSG